MNSRPPNTPLAPFLRSESGRILSYSAEVSGTINDQPMEIRGNGMIDERKGQTIGHYRLLRMARLVDPLLLISVMITGYPNACESLPPTDNPFAGSDYTYRRLLRFATGEILSYTADIAIRRTELVSRFVLAGAAPSFDSSAVKPIVESWCPDGSQRVAGEFNVEWVDEVGTVASAIATSLYNIVEPRHLRRKQRHIDLTASLSGDVLHLSQSSRLVVPAAAHEDR